MTMPRVRPVKWHWGVAYYGGVMALGTVVALWTG